MAEVTPHLHTSKHQVVSMKTLLGMVLHLCLLCRVAAMLQQCAGGRKSATTCPLLLHAVKDAFLSFVQQQLIDTGGTATTPEQDLSAAQINTLHCWFWRRGGVALYALAMCSSDLPVFGTCFSLDATLSLHFCNGSCH